MSAGHPARRAGRRLRACRAMATAAARGNSKAVPSPTWGRTACRSRSIGSPGQALAAASTRGPATVVSLVSFHWSIRGTSRACRRKVCASARG
jgi:hypothetical protein